MSFIFHVFSWKQMFTLLQIEETFFKSIQFSVKSFLFEQKCVCYKHVWKLHKNVFFDKNFVKVTFYLIWRNFFLWDTHYSEKGDFTEFLKDSGTTQLHCNSVKFTSYSLVYIVWIRNICTWLKHLHIRII